MNIGHNKLLKIDFFPLVGQNSNCSYSIARVT